MKIRIELEANVVNDYSIIDLQDLKITHEEWLSMNNEKRCEVLDEYVENHIEHPRFIMQSHEIQ
jgi:hypothetical protein